MDAVPGLLALTLFPALVDCERIESIPTVAKKKKERKFRASFGQWLTGTRGSALFAAFPGRIVTERRGSAQVALEAAQGR